MGAPKQKWTHEEEVALRAGVVKHGAGKWRTILKDPEFSAMLSLRSNVDLKDKWRNLSVTANGWSSRDRGRLAVKKNKVAKRDANPLASTPIGGSVGNDIHDAKPLLMPTDADADPKKPQLRLENLIIEAVTRLKEPTGSSKAAIAEYIKEQYQPPPNFKRLLSYKLKILTATGKLIKVRRTYRIAPNPGYLEQIGSKSVDRKNDDSNADTGEIKLLTKSQIDAELEKIRQMNVPEAAAAAARAVAEAEAAIAEAEEAARNAEAAEADAEVAKAFALVAAETRMQKISGKNWIVRAFI